MVKKILTYLVFFTGLTAYGQEHFNNAYKSFTEGNLERAKMHIDSASVHPETMKDAQVWYLRGFIYKELYNKREKGNPVSSAREEALSSFIKSIALDTTAESVRENKVNLQYLATTFYNDAVSHLNIGGYEAAILSYQKYRDAMKIYDPFADLKNRDIEFRLALASAYTKLYEADNKNDSLFEQARKLYIEVLAADPENLSANYNLGILYYNKAVNIINALDYDMDMMALMEIQEKCVDIFKQSLPYMEKAYALNPKRKETLVGLSGIYFSLNEFEKSNAIKAELEQLDK